MTFEKDSIRICSSQISQFSTLSQLSNAVNNPLPGAMHRVGLGASFLGSGAARHQKSTLLAFISKYLKLNPATIGATITIFGSILTAIPVVERAGRKIYSWIISFFTVSITVDSNDRLHRDIINWVGSQVLEPRGHRTLTAQSETIRSESKSMHHWGSPRGEPTKRNDTHNEKKAPIEYLPIFYSTWFFLEGKIYLVHHNQEGIRSNESHSRSKRVERDAKSSLVIMCLGRSHNPLKRFLKVCRDYADKDSIAFTQVWTTKRGGYFDSVIQKPRRDIGTVYFDQDVKNQLFADIEKYLDPNNRRFYMARGIPYRRGYLLHGPPGTGKTSLSLALAGHFGLALHLVHMPSIMDDTELEQLFSSLPPLCVVLLEDIDAMGMKRNKDKSPNEEDNEQKTSNYFGPPRGGTLSGLLTVLDGIASQEGRIVLMTSNFADKLDKALIRPGRVDRMIFLGHISPNTAMQMFIGMFSPAPESTDASVDLSDDGIKKLALDFSSYIPENMFTPAQIQEYLLQYRDSPEDAAMNISGWVEEHEYTMKEEAESLAEQARKKKAKKDTKRNESMSKVIASLSSISNGVQMVEEFKESLQRSDVSQK
jgi:mitochondrial chaperone BCS1